MTENTSNLKPIETLDCVGLYCPVPVIQTSEHMKSIKPGEILEVLADDPAAEEDIKRYAKRTGHEIVKFEKKEDHIRFLIKKSK
jgi:TusA-related sulfurtransferase